MSGESVPGEVTTRKEGGGIAGKGAGYVVAQTGLMLAALLAPPLGARSDSWPGAVAVAGGVLAVAGLGVVGAASAGLGRRSLSPFPKPRDGAALVEHGVFSVVRHPIYSGLTLFVLGWGLAWGSVVAVAGALVLLAFFDVKACREERWLEEKFAGYTEYRRRVRKLVPFIY